MFGGGPNPVIVSRCYLKTKTNHSNNGNRDCYGAVMAHGRNAFTMTDTYIEYLTGDRSVVQLWNCGNILLRGNMILASQEIDIRVKPGNTIEILDNIGSTCNVIISTNPVGIQMNEPSWDPSKILYNDSLAKNAKLTI